jgi:hypothetical protein
MPTNNFKVGELLNKRSENSKTWINFDGSFTTEIHGGPVHYVDENGNLQNINTDLFDEADFDQIDFPVAKDGDSLFYEVREKVKDDKKKNRLDRDRFDFQGLRVPFDCKVPRNIKRGYSIGKGKSKLKFIPVGASTSKGYVEGNKITYQDVWNDADLVLEVLPTGIKETIILKSERAPFDFSFEVEGELNDELKIQPPWLQDANGEKRDVLQGVREVNGKTVLSLAADVTGLVYPIAIDPTVNINTPTDTYIKSSNANANYATETETRVGYNNGETFNSYFNFDLSSIPTNAVISYAGLSIIVVGKFIYGAGNAILYFVPQANYGVNTNSLTWNNPGTSLSTGDPTASLNEADSGSYSTVIAVTKALENMIQNKGTRTNQHIKLTYSHVSTGASGTLGFYLASQETTSYSKPSLSVTYNIPPTAPTVTAPNGGEAWNSLHTLSWNSAGDPQPIDIFSSITNETYESFSSTYTRYSQSFTSNGERLASLKFAIRNYLGSSQTGSIKTELWNADTFGRPTTKVSDIQTHNFSLIASEIQNITSTPTTPINIANGGRYAIVFIYVSGMQVAITGRTVQFANEIPYRYNGTAWSTANVPSFSMLINLETTNNLKYQIQISTNNGSTWKDIVALTTAGATSYNYDFINEPETSTAKIRVRAYDGSAYGQWDESNGVFTIQHNAAPTTPTNLSPSGVVKDRALVNRLSWQHNDANADPQAKFDLQWRLQGTSVWNTVTQTTINQYWDAPANTFPKGVIEWQVRTYDQAGLSSPYANLITFTTGDKPANPTITNPAEGSKVSIANPTVQWSSIGQTDYHLKVLNTSNAQLWESIKTSTNKAETILYNLQNSTSYKVQVAIKNADGLWSDFVTVNISVSYTPPAIPDIELIKGNSFIEINILDQVPSGTQPTVLYHEIYKEIDREFVLIATNVSNQFIDYHVASGETIRYFVRTIGNNNTFSDTITFTESISFKGVWLHIVDSPQDTIKQFKFDGDGRSSKWGLESAVHQFQGRKYPVIETGIMEEYMVDFALRIVDSVERDALNRITMSGQTVCYRDGRGRKVFGVFVDVPLEDENWGGYSTKLSLLKIDFKEGIE